MEHKEVPTIETTYTSMNALKVKDFEEKKNLIQEYLNQQAYLKPSIEDDYSFKEAKAKRAVLNKTYNALEDYRKSCVKEYTEDFQSQMKELAGLIKAREAEFKEPIDEYEAQTREEKKATTKKDTLPMVEVTVRIYQADEEKFDNYVKRINGMTVKKKEI